MGANIAADVRRLQDAARALAYQHVDQFAAQVEALAQASQDVATGGDAYPAGIRDAARQLADDLCRRRLLIECLLEKAR